MGDSLEVSTWAPQSEVCVPGGMAVLQDRRMTEV